MQNYLEINLLKDKKLFKHMLCQYCIESSVNSFQDSPTYLYNILKQAVDAWALA